MNNIFKPKSESDILNDINNLHVDKDFFINLYKKDKKLFSYIIEKKSALHVPFSLTFILKRLKNGQKIGPFTIFNQLEIIISIIEALLPNDSIYITRRKTELMYRINQNLMEDFVYFIELK